jgi:hypothetical protein
VYSLRYPSDKRLGQSQRESESGGKDRKSCFGQESNSDSQSCSPGAGKFSLQWASSTVAKMFLLNLIGIGFFFALKWVTPVFLHTSEFIVKILF